MELDKDIKVYSYFTVDMDPDKLSKLQNALPGQVMFVPIAPGIAFRYAPESNGKKLANPSPASEGASKASVDRTPTI
jgi:hypothetical protein